MTSRRLMSWTIRPRQAGSTMLPQHAASHCANGLARRLARACSSMNCAAHLSTVSAASGLAAVAFVSDFRAAGSLPCAQARAAPRRRPCGLRPA